MVLQPGPNPASREHEFVKGVVVKDFLITGVLALSLFFDHPVCTGNLVVNDVASYRLV